MIVTDALFALIAAISFLVCAAAVSTVATAAFASRVVRDSESRSNRDDCEAA